jgi:hypothetical protein
MDWAPLPRDKACAGWITPQVVEELRLDVDEYRAERTCQAVIGFAVGLVMRKNSQDPRCEGTGISGLPRGSTTSWREEGRYHGLPFAL